MKGTITICDKYEKTFEIYRLTNDNGMEVEIISTGAVITKILTKDKNGVLENVVLGYEDLSDYFTNSPDFGAVVGRTAGRIGNGSFEINGEKYELSKNNNGNTLHGGNKGFHMKQWKGELVNREDSVGVKLSCSAEDGEEGYPGNVNVEIYYKLDNDNKLHMEYKGTTDKATLLNLTNHSYYNLSGNGKRKVLDQKVMINSDNICEIDEKSIVTGRLIPVEGTPFDFRDMKEIGRDIEKKDNEQIRMGTGYDHPFILNKDKKPDVIMYDEISGRVMEMSTSAKAVVVYSMNFAGGEKLSCGKGAETRMACCFETQAPPVGYNDEFIEDSIVDVDKEYSMTTVFRFYTK